jgi:hypothetical protein
VHNATGELGEVSAYRVRSNFTTLGARSATLATFVDDRTAAVVRSGVGEGTVTQFGFMPGIPYPSMDPYDPSPDFNRAPIDGSVPYLLDFLDQAGATPRVNVTHVANGTTVLRVETPLLVSSKGAVLTLLNWHTRVVPPAAQPSLSLRISARVELKAQATRVDSVELGKPIKFTCTPLNDVVDRDGKTSFMLVFDIDVVYGDFIRITV